MSARISSRGSMAGDPCAAVIDRAVRVALSEGDVVVRRGNDEIRPGTRIEQRGDEAARRRGRQATS